MENMEFIDNRHVVVDEDIWYIQRKIDSEQRPEIKLKLLKQREVLKDSIIIYRINRNKEVWII